MWITTRSVSDQQKHAIRFFLYLILCASIISCAFTVISIAGDSSALLNTPSASRFYRRDSSSSSSPNLVQSDVRIQEAKAGRQRLLSTLLDSPQQIANIIDQSSSAKAIQPLNITKDDPVFFDGALIKLYLKSGVASTKLLRCDGCTQVKQPMINARNHSAKPEKMHSIIVPGEGTPEIWRVHCVNLTGTTSPYHNITGILFRLVASTGKYVCRTPNTQKNATAYGARPMTFLSVDKFVPTEDCIWQLRYDLSSKTPTPQPSANETTVIIVEPGTQHVLTVNFYQFWYNNPYFGIGALMNYTDAQASRYGVELTATLAPPDSINVYPTLAGYGDPVLYPFRNGSIVSMLAKQGAMDDNQMQYISVADSPCIPYGTNSPKYATEKMCKRPILNNKHPGSILTDEDKWNVTILGDPSQGRVLLWNIGHGGYLSYELANGLDLIQPGLSHNGTRIMHWVETTSLVPDNTTTWILQPNFGVQQDQWFLVNESLKTMLGYCFYCNLPWSPGIRLRLAVAKHVPENVEIGITFIEEGS